VIRQFCYLATETESKSCKKILLHYKKKLQ